MLTSLAIALLLALLFTCLIVLGEVSYRSKASLRACISQKILIYAAIVAIGNLASTLLATTLVSSKIPITLSNWAPFFYAFFGVFAFEGILSNSNITFADKKILTIYDWIGRTRDPAVARAIEKQVEFADNLETKSAQALTAQLTEPQLNAYLDQYVGIGTATRITLEANASGAEVKLSKALELATRAPGKSLAILKSLKKK